MDTRNVFKLSSWATFGLLAALGSAQAAVTDIATAPLVTSATSSVLPNVHFILDDSGSMYWDFMPDVVNDSYCKNTSGAYSGTCCGDTASSGGSGSSSCWIKNTSTAAPFGTWRGHPLFLSGSFNGVMYNPAITYSPPLNADGSSKLTMNSANTSAWTVVKNDAYNVQSTTSINLTTQFPDLEWCTDATLTDCLRNDNYILPGTVNSKTYKTFNATVATGSGNVATGSPAAPTTASRNFGPHFYTIVPGEYCDTTGLRNCQASQSGAYVYPAYIRWCNASSATTAATVSANVCQATKTDVYKYIRYPTTFFTPAVAAVPPVVGQPFIAAVAAVKAQASFTVSLTGTCNGSNKVQVTALTVNGTNILTSSTSSDFTATNVATSLRSVVGKGYTATRSGTVVTVYGSTAQGNITYPLSFTYTKTGSRLCNFVTTPPRQPFRAA